MQSRAATCTLSRYSLLTGEYAWRREGTGILPGDALLDRIRRRSDVVVPGRIFVSAAVHLCEPGIVRSPDGRQLAALLRENRRVRNSHVMFSNDEGKTWSAPRELLGALTGDRHTAQYGPDGRLFVSFRDTTLESSTRGEDGRAGREAAGVDLPPLPS